MVCNYDCCGDRPMVMRECGQDGKKNYEKVQARN